MINIKKDLLNLIISNNENFKTESISCNNFIDKKDYTKEKAIKWIADVKQSKKINIFFYDRTTSRSDIKFMWSFRACFEDDIKRHRITLCNLSMGQRIKDNKVCIRLECHHKHKNNELSRVVIDIIEGEGDNQDLLSDELRDFIKSQEYNNIFLEQYKIETEKELLNIDKNIGYAIRDSEYEMREYKLSLQRIGNLKDYKNII